MLLAALTAEGVTTGGLILVLSVVIVPVLGVSLLMQK